MRWGVFLSTAVFSENIPGADRVSGTARNGGLWGVSKKGVVPRDTTTLAAGFTGFTGFTMGR